MSIKVAKADSPKRMKDFLDLPARIYSGCAQYVPDFRSDIRRLFNPRYNAGLEFSSIQPFVAYKDGEPVGRIVGVVNRKANKTWNRQVVRFSMIEFIDDQEVSSALLDTVAHWGRQQGMDTLQGPMGITDFDKEGMLVEDFELMGSMTAYYNLPYYPKHLEQLGFVKEVDWLQVRINIPQEVPARFRRVAQYARETVGLKVEKKDGQRRFAGRIRPKDIRPAERGIRPHLRLLCPVAPTSRRVLEEVCAAHGHATHTDD